MKLFSQIASLSALLCAIASGCAMGVCRYKVIFHFQYATIEMPEHVHPVFKPAAVVAGVASDIAICAVDAVITPAVVVIPSFEVNGLQPTTHNNVIEKCITAPIWYPFTYSVDCLFFDMFGEGYLLGMVWC